MTGWLSRGLVAIAVGAVFAFAVTVQPPHVDLQTAGAIVMFAGIGYLLVHLALLGRERGWGTGGGPRDRYDGRAAGRYDGRQDDRYDRYDRSYAEPYDDRGYAAGQARPAAYPGAYDRPTGPARQAPPAWTGGADRPDDIRMLPVVRDEPYDRADDDTTALDLRGRDPGTER